MKKAKIIVPALALLALSVTASITGTVAWFTVASNANAQFTQIGVQKLEGKLARTLTAGTGTRVVDDKILPLEGTVESTYVKLTHASYNVTNGDLWSNTMGEIEKQTSAQYDANTYFKFDFTITFSYDFGSTVSTADYNLYFDYSTSKLNTTGGTELDADKYYAARGFRMAFETTFRKVVWSPWQNKTLDQNPGTTKPNSCYQSAADATTDYTITDVGNLIYMGDDSLPTITGSTASNARKDCLGTFTKPETGTKSELAVKCTMWLEGNDENISNKITSIDEVLDGSLNFFIKTAANS